MGKETEPSTPEISEKDALKVMRRLYVAVLRKALESDKPPTASMLAVIGKFLDSNEVKGEEVDPKDSEMTDLLARLPVQPSGGGRWNGNSDESGDAVENI